MSLLEVRNLSTRFKLIDHTVRAVDGISFSVEHNETLAIVGESGCGKSVTAMSLMNLIQAPGEIDSSSEIIFEGKNVLEMNDSELKELRGGKIAMIFQEPSASFNPLFRIGSQIAEALKIHQGAAKDEALVQAEKLLDSVKISEPDRRVKNYPFQLSGGMLQRAMTALAISCSPKLLLADEPTTALDVTIQAQIIKLLQDEASEKNMSIIFVTHDLELIDGFADRIMLLYAGRVFEQSTAPEFFDNPLHPYGEDLMNAIPRMGLFKDEHKLYTIKGQVPDEKSKPIGCAYAPRCRKCFDKCVNEEPPLFSVNSRNVRCWLFENKNLSTDGEDK
ncbi:MAG: ABC transporter ATP-binding protein [Spirochaetales bacterium]|nr:ABC transporter ATP-binding protein [Spirochaetales bacterium]